MSFKKVYIYSTIIIVIILLLLNYFVYDRHKHLKSFYKEPSWIDSEFQKRIYSVQKDKRYAPYIQRLKDIDLAQNAFSLKYGYNTSDYDTLINFIKYDSLPIVKIKGERPDTLSYEQALELKFMYYDTSYIAVSDTLFIKGFNPDSLKFYPNSKGVLLKLKPNEFNSFRKNIERRLMIGFYSKNEKGIYCKHEYYIFP